MVRCASYIGAPTRPRGSSPGWSSVKGRGAGSKPPAIAAGSRATRCGAAPPTKHSLSATDRREMNAISAAGEAASWRVDWAWSVPLIVATVVIHAFGLGLLHERVVRVVSRIVERRHFTPLFAVVMGVVVLLDTI